MSELTFEQMLEDNIKTIRTGEVVEGTVIAVKPEEIVLNIQYKSDGILTKSEYTNDSSVDLTQAVKPGDTILATEVSRITRSTKQLCDIIELAKDRHIKLVLGTIIVDCTKELDPMTEGMLKMMGVFSELERNMISQRVKSGMENAKAKGKTIGRPAVTADSIPAIFYKHYPKYKKGEINKKELSRLCNLSYPTIYKYLRIVEG